MRVANLDMTDPSQQCPPGFKLLIRTTPPLRTCGRQQTFFTENCISNILYPVHGIEYSQVCGRVVGYQLNVPQAFNPYHTDSQHTIDTHYVEGVSLTHGQSPRTHIWTFAGAQDETASDSTRCPCTQPDLPYTGTLPPFIGQDYFCDTGSRDFAENIFYPDDPLWDGQGCGGNSTCCSFNNPPWFCKQLSQLTTDDIEMRLCADSTAMSNEDTPLETVEIYIR